mgnify:CR=1 FL=1|jgi:glutaredoxin|tara:strand:+ start:47 stop:409 length:363 start_codon:yes stop_codon:yes gene_type:complete
MKITNRVKLFLALCGLLLSASCASSSYSLKPINLESDAVIMYTTSWCNACSEARAFLEKHGVEYVEVDYENKKEFKRLLETAINLEYRGVFDAVPVFIVRKQILVGYSPETILWILGNPK